ncbi:MAG: hypothetical protein A2V46_16380 [Bacteroidetes bacterium RBG_19FT_COMBO_42_7]|nr:MAG: hypothetical protein A2V46_16380 [Bacteroidetes bacterium RBG_19FT_COMBO_42_7]
MTTTNEALIQKVFQEMLIHKPSLQKMMIADDEEEETLDPRMQGDIIIKNFPWPIGIELRRLFSASMRQPDRLRLDQIFKTIERTMQFISFVMICQIWKDKKEGKLEISGNLAKEFQSRIVLLSMGNYTWLIRTVGNLLNEKKRPWFLPEMGENFNNRFFEALDFWVPERNEIGHYQINLKQEEIERRCVEYEEKLAYILQRIAFLCKYKLVSVREIKVNHPKNQPAKFDHIFDILNSSDSDFIAREMEEEKYSESHSILLMKSLKTMDDYLNLSPLIIDTNCEIIDNKEKFDIKKDIFMYTKFRDDHLMYIGTEVTEKCDLRSLHNYQILLSQFKDMIATISG